MLEPWYEINISVYTLLPWKNDRSLGTKRILTFFKTFVTFLLFPEKKNNRSPGTTPSPTPEHDILKTTWRSTLIFHNIHINLACVSVCLFVCLFVCLYPINVKTAEPIGPKFFVGSRVTPGKVYGWSNFQKFDHPSKFDFWKFWKSTKFFLKIRGIFCFCYLLTMRTPVYFISNENFYKWNKRWARSALRA